MKNLFAFFVLTMVVVFLTGCGMSDDTVAKVGSLEISKDEYIKALQQRYPDKSTYTDLDSLAKMNVLDPIVRSKRALADAYDLNLDDNEDVQKIVAMEREKYVSSKYFERQIVDQLLPDEKIQAHFNQQKFEFKASHILIAIPGAQNKDLQRSPEEAIQIATEVHEKVKSGEDFVSLVKKYSDDPSKKTNDGNLGYFSSGQMVPLFEQALFNMELGEISEPVKTRFGYHIIRLEDKRENPRMVNQSFEDEYMKIKRSMYQSVAKQGNELWKQHVDSLKTAHDLTVLDENIETIVSATTLLIEEQGGKINAEMFASSVKDLPLVTWDGGQYSFAQLIKDNKNNLNRIQRQLMNSSQLKQLAERRCLQIITLDIALEHGYDREKDVIRDLENVQAQRMLMQLEKAQVSEKIEVTDEEMVKYYEENKEEFVIKPKIEIWEIQVKTESVAKSVLKKAQSGQDFEELAKKYSVDKIFKKKGGYLGFKEAGHRGAISRGAMKAGANTLVGPIKYRANWAVVKTGALNEKQYKSYEESKTRITSKLKRKMTAERKKEWEQELLDNYPLTINYKVFDSI